MKALGQIGYMICAVCIAASVLSSLIPQKRTRKLLSFVIGLFLLSSVSGAVIAASDSGELAIPDFQADGPPPYSVEDMNDAVAQKTADNLVQAINELLLNEGIRADDIKLNLKITDERRIYVSRVVIYINEADAVSAAKIRSIVNGNLSKEPEIYVSGEEGSKAAE